MSLNEELKSKIKKINDRELGGLALLLVEEVGKDKKSKLQIEELVLEEIREILGAE